MNDGYESETMQVNFRMPRALHQRVKLASQRNHRTVTAEIVATLEEKYPYVSQEEILGRAMHLLMKKLPEETREKVGRDIQEILDQARADIDSRDDDSDQD